jgi:hypothetical protein
MGFLLRKLLVAAIMIVLAILIPVVAFGQNGGGPVDNPCAIPGATIPVYYTDVNIPPGKMFRCMPKPGGDGTAANVRMNSKGVTAFWYCPDPVDKPERYHMTFAAGTWARIASGNLTADTPLADPSLSPVWCPFANEMLALQPVVAPKIQWTVSGATAFVIAGTTIKSVAGRAPIGATCDCRAPSKIGAVTYCTFTGAAAANVMAACKASP